MSKTDALQQTTLAGFELERTDESLTTVVKLRLESSNRKNAHLRECIGVYQEALRVFGDRLASFKPWQWGRETPAKDRIRKIAFPPEDQLLAAQSLQEAGTEVSDKLAIWRDEGRPGKRPFSDFERGAWLRATNQCYTIAENDRGYGIRLNIKPYAAEWFGIDTSDPYAVERLEQIVAGELKPGGCTVRLPEDSETPVVEVPVTETIEVYSADEVDRMNVLGIDLGETMLYAGAVTTPDGDIERVELESGREFRHHREQLSSKRDELARQGDLRGVRQCKGERENYTDHVTHVASRELVDLAADHAPGAIAIEGLTGYRESAADPIHDWPQHMICEKIAYKALSEGLPVVTVDSEHTSTTCRKCGQTAREYRNGSDFHCRRCGYEVHADVNAAINIARRLLREGK
jgi:IS605 OrfB family transposase